MIPSCFNFQLITVGLALLQMTMVVVAEAEVPVVVMAAVVEVGTAVAEGMLLGAEVVAVVVLLPGPETGFAQAVATTALLASMAPLLCL